MGISLLSSDESTIDATPKFVEFDGSCESNLFQKEQIFSSIQNDNVITESIEQICANDFRKFVVKNNIPIVQVQEILKIFQPVCPTLPLSYATLLDTKDLEPYKIREFGEKSKFVYLGIRRQIKKTINP